MGGSWENTSSQSHRWHDHNGMSPNDEKGTRQGYAKASKARRERKTKPQRKERSTQEENMSEENMPESSAPSLDITIRERYSNPQR